MKKARLSSILWTMTLLCWGLWFSPAALSGEEAPFHERLNALYVRSQKMVEHGRHGHTGELVEHAKTVARDSDALIGWLEANKRSRTQVTMNLIAAKESAAEAVRTGEARQERLALLAARKAFFQIKRARQQMEK